MVAQDSFGRYYREHLDGSYDVLDRIVLRAYYPVGTSPGGFRWWWRELHGTDENLDNAHLMRMAGRFSRRVKAWSGKHGVTVRYCYAGERMHEIAEEKIPEDPRFRGIFLILISRATASLWSAKWFPNGGLDLRRKTPMPWVNHYSFHILDPHWGHLTIQMCSHPPFQALVILNGHEYTARQALHKSIPFTKEGNCFTDIANAADLAKVADTLSRSPGAIGRLRRVCEHWIYTCLSFALPRDEQERSRFYYQYSLFQAEYSRNLLFSTGQVMEQVFDAVIDRIRAPLDIRTLTTIFGYKHRPFRRKGRPLRFEVAVEKPTYDMTVFRVHFGSLTVRMYTKGERVLRAEVIANSTTHLRSGKSLDKFAQIVARLHSILDRFLNFINCVDASIIGGDLLDELPLPSQLGKTRIGGVDLNKPRMRAVLEAVLALAPSPSGFTSSELAAKVREITRSLYTPRQAAYDLKKLRAKTLVALPKHTRRYEPTPDGLRNIAALVVLRDKVVKPVLAGAGYAELPPPPENVHPIDECYRVLHVQMRCLFNHLNLAA